MYRTVLETDYIKVVDFFFDIFLKGMCLKVLKSKFIYSHTVILKNFNIKE